MFWIIAMIFKHGLFYCIFFAVAFLLFLGRLIYDMFSDKY